MSLILSGPKRIYVLLLFWERNADPCAGCPCSLSRVSQTLGAEESGEDANGCVPLCHVLMACRIFRTLWGRLIGFSLLVLKPQSAHGAPARRAEPVMRRFTAERGGEGS